MDEALEATCITRLEDGARLLIWICLGLFLK
ncbi:hypothetical protein MHYMCMPSP_00235 [Hyalomma marginatum]|uniref:Uncharacterized protein n=1 Tax=Hyalomma marginatum TaxID=34627 RepID=A0A8S4C242_9ACAR|nr:hypothetical protein MHYMCMPSP_00235 [Hyalomma marginatum]CAG7599828.1 hypothetical protein MHYMCMPASI_01131 [Hyalomma marginatum]